MTNAASIKDEILFVVGGKLSAWTIGLTSDPVRRKKHLREAYAQDVTRWQQWRADSLSDAKLVRSKFIDEGMKMCAQADEIVSDEFPTFIYIY